MKRLWVALVVALAACTARDRPEPPLRTSHDDAAPAAPSLPPPPPPLPPPPPPVVYEISDAPEAPARVHTMVLSFGHSVRSTIVVPGAVWIATFEDLIWLRTDAQGVAGSGTRIAFHGRLTATPDGQHLFRVDDREVVALDAHGKDTATRAALPEQIRTVAFSRAGHLMGVLTNGDFRLTVFRVADLHVVAAAPCNKTRVNLATSLDEALVSVGGTIFDTQTGHVASAVPPETPIIDDDERHVAPASTDARFSGHYALLHGWPLTPGGETPPGWEPTRPPSSEARATLDDGELVLSAGTGGEARVRLAPRGTPTVRSELAGRTWQPTHVDFVGELGSRVVLSQNGADIAVLDKRTLAEVEHFLFADHGMLHVRRGGTWETTGDAAALELAVLCVDGNRVEPAAACKYRK